MKIVGFCVLVLGFLWIVLDCYAGFVAYQHSHWNWQAQHLPEGETIKRSDAIEAMRTLSIDLKNRHREVLVPALLMLGGGLALQFGSRRRATNCIN